MAHRLLVIAYNVIARREPYRELGQEPDGGARPAGTLAEATGVADFQGSKVQ